MITQNLLQLSSELDNFLSEDLPIAIKYRLTPLFKEVKSRVKFVTETRDELIKSLDESGTIPATLENGEENPIFNEYKRAFQTILDEVVELIPYPVVTLAELDGLKSKNNYPMLFELVIK